MNPRLVPAFAVLLGLACSSTPAVQNGDDDENGSSSGGSDDTLSCPQREGSDDSDSDCIDLELPRKLDCLTESSMNDALEAGCEREDPKEDDDYDVCCPKSVRGTEVIQVSCRQKEGAETEDDCADRPKTPKKLDCDDGEQTDEALEAGCVREKSGDSDVCCPLSVDGIRS